MLGIDTLEPKTIASEMHRQARRCIGHSAMEIGKVTYVNSLFPKLAPFNSSYEEVRLFVRLEALKQFFRKRMVITIFAVKVIRLADTFSKIA